MWIFKISMKRDIFWNNVGKSYIYYKLWLLNIEKNTWML